MPATNTAKKKLLIYYLIILIMIGGTIFLLFQNYLISSSKKLFNLVAPGQSVEKPIGETATITPLDEKSSASGQLKEVDIFDSEKFRSLKENLLGSSTEQVQPGKRNPFRPNE